MALLTDSPLMDKAPTEIRMMIFRYALRAEKSLLNSWLALQNATDTLEYETPALFTVSRTVSHEALGAFFEVNTILLSERDDLEGAVARRDGLRHVELTHCGCDVTTNGIRLPENYLSIILARPRIMTITIVLDGFFRTTIRKILEKRPEFVGLRCLKIGFFEVQLVPAALKAIRGISAHSPRIFIKNELLSDILPESKMLTSAPNASLSGLQGRGEPRGPLYHRLARSFAHWLMSYELLVQQRLEPGRHWVDPDELRMLAHFEDIVLVVPEGVLWRSELMSGITAKLQDLDPVEHSAEVLEWATNLMAENLYFLLRDEEIFDDETGEQNGDD